MAAKRDLETILDDIEALLKANLNAKIVEIEAEKVASGAGAVGLATIEDAAYFQQSWSDKMLDRSPAIFFGVEQIQAVGVGPATLEIFKIFVEVVLVDSGQDALAGKRIHRYSRAIKEVFHANFNALPGGSEKTNIETVRPVSFALDENSSEEVKVGGVSITTQLA